MAPRVTVLLPTHNRADILSYAIRSILWQSEPDFELLIVGDGCTDGTAQVVASFRDHRIRWFDFPKAPLSGYANRNVALREAQGGYVAYAQHDDIWLPDHLQRLLAAMEASGAEWSYSRPMWATPRGVVLPMSVDLTNRNELEHFLHVENLIPSTFIMHRRQAFDRVGFWPEDVPRVADWVFWKSIITTSSGCAIAYCNTPTALHFRAAWRREGSSLEQAIADASLWPEACRVATEPGVPEQKAFFDAIAAAPGPWTDLMRSRADEVAHRLAWAWAVNVDHELRELKQRWTSRSALSRQLASVLFRKSLRR